MHPTQQVVVTHPSTHEHRSFVTNHADDGINEEYEPFKILPFDYSNISTLI
jgi:hypothetical protein